MRVCSDCARKASAQRLRKEYEISFATVSQSMTLPCASLISFHDGELVDDFAMRLFGVIHQLKVLADAVWSKRAQAHLVQDDDDDDEPALCPCANVDNRPPP